MVLDPSASTSSHDYDMKKAGDLEPACFPSLVDAFRHASMRRSVRRTVVVVRDSWWRLERHVLVEEMLSINCTS